jgi:hypothetical protein
MKVLFVTPPMGNWAPWTLSQYAQWMKAAGFGPIETHGNIPKTLPWTTLILANRHF